MIVGLRGRQDRGQTTCGEKNDERRGKERMGSHGEAAVVPLVGLAVVMLHPAVRRDVLLPALEHLLRRAQRRATLPLVHRARVAGVGHGGGAAGDAAR